MYGTRYMISAIVVMLLVQEISAGILTQDEVISLLKYYSGLKNGNRNNGTGNGNSNGHCIGNCAKNTNGNWNGNDNVGNENGNLNGNCVGNCIGNKNGNHNGNNNNMSNKNGNYNGNCYGNCFHNTAGNINGNNNTNSSHNNGNYNGNCRGNCFYKKIGNGSKKNKYEPKCVGQCSSPQSIPKVAESSIKNIADSKLTCKSIDDYTYYVVPETGCREVYRVHNVAKLKDLYIWKCGSTSVFDLDICACNQWYFTQQSTCSSSWFDWGGL